MLGAGLTPTSSALCRLLPAIRRTRAGTSRGRIVFQSGLRMWGRSRTLSIEVTWNRWGFRRCPLRFEWEEGSRFEIEKEKQHGLFDHCFRNPHSFHSAPVEFLTGLRRAAVWRRKYEEARFDLVFSRDAGRQRHRAHEVYLSFQCWLG